MKEKIKIIFLILVFILLILGIKFFLDKQDEIFIQNQIMGENTNKISGVSNTKGNNDVNGLQDIDIQSEESIIEVNDKNFEAEVLKADKTVLIDFYADWCNPCKVLSPIVEEVANEEKDIKFVKINIDKAEEIANKYNIMSIPTLVVIKSGEEVNRSIGVISKEKIIDLLK